MHLFFRYYTIGVVYENVREHRVHVLRQESRKWVSSVDAIKVIGFHNPEEEYGFLSNWYLSEFRFGGITFSSMEQYMMYQKAILFGDTKIAGKILETSDVAEIKALGRAVAQYVDSVWAGRRQIIVYRGLTEKFRQNPDLRNRLVATGEAVLAECAVKDRIWGLGLSMNDGRRFDMSEWQGQNLLGYALMEVRQNLMIY